MSFTGCLKGQGLSRAATGELLAVDPEGTVVVAAATAFVQTAPIPMNKDISVLDVLTLTIAVIGAVLGVIGTVRDFRRDRIRLLVIPKVSVSTSQNVAITGDRPTRFMRQLLANGFHARLCIEVINLSTFPVTISDVGFGRTTGRRHAIINPEMSLGQSWPTRLEPRQSVTFHCPFGVDIDPAVVVDAVAYASTDCQETHYGTSPIFKQYVRELESRDANSGRRAA